jgi:lipopolysaccharide heptosyltransferase II
VKDILKSIYLNFREHLLYGLGTLISENGSADVGVDRDIGKILFIRIDRIGDLVLSTPAFKAIKRTFPYCELAVLASASNQPLLIDNPYVDKIFVYDQMKGLTCKIGIIKQLREYHPDLVIDPYSDYEVKTALISFLSGAKMRVGYTGYGRETFFNIKVRTAKEKKHFVDQTLDVLEPLGIVAKDKKPDLFLTEEEKQWGRKWIKESVIGCKHIVGIHPGAYYESQRWLPERFAELANEVRKDGETDVIIFGGPGDKSLVARITSMLDENILSYVTDDIRGFVALLSCCRIFICNNSGPLHMAVAINIPTISIMGPTDKDRWMPVGKMHKVLRADDIPCIGCNLGYCEMKTHECMNSITSSMVLEAVSKVLKG